MFRPCIYKHGMYNFTFLWTCIIRRNKLLQFRFEAMILCIITSCLDHYATSVHVRFRIITVFVYFFIWSLVSYVRRRSGSALAPAMTLPASASTWIALKPMPATKQASEAAIWWHTPARLRNSQGPPTWKVAGCCSIDMCLAEPAPDKRIGGPAARKPAYRSQRCWPETAFGQASSWLGSSWVP